MGRKGLPALVGLLVTLIACSVGSWFAIHPALALFVVPDAIDIKIARLKWNTWQIRYHAPGAPTTWFTDVGQRLEAHHWSSPDQKEYGALVRTYSRATRFGPCELREWAYLTFNPLQPHIAQITVHRNVVLRW
jgi:hypothetical protein